MKIPSLALMVAGLAACSAEAPEPAPHSSDPADVIASDGPLTPALSPAEIAELKAGYLEPANCPRGQRYIEGEDGTNCFGIAWSRCGADQLDPVWGQRVNPVLRQKVEALVGHDRIRWIAPMQPVTDDLNPGRLNIGYDEDGLVDHIDCY